MTEILAIIFMAVFFAAVVITAALDLPPDERWPWSKRRNDEKNERRL